MAEDSQTAATLDALEATRAAVETEYLECMHGLEIRADGLRALVDQLALASIEEAPDVPAAEADGVTASTPSLMGPAVERPSPAERAEWELPTAGIRGWLTNWLIGDMLPTLDRRHGALVGALANLQDDIAGLHDDFSGALQRVQDHAAGQLVAQAEKQRVAQDQPQVATAQARGEDLRRWRGVGEVLNHAVEALTQVTRLSERLRAVVNAKDAEALQRAVEGPALQIEVIFDELTRRQEALLAELVGRRQELDAMIESVSASD